MRKPTALEALARSVSDWGVTLLLFSKRAANTRDNQRTQCETVEGADDPSLLVPGPSLLRGEGDGTNVGTFPETLLASMRRIVFLPKARARRSIAGCIPHSGSRLSRAAIAILVQTLTWLLAAPLASGANLPGYAKHVPAETPAARQHRHARVTERRSGTILLAHRGAATLATENTSKPTPPPWITEPTGCEIDVRRCADGVLVLSMTTC